MNYTEFVKGINEAATNPDGYGLNTGSLVQYSVLPNGMIKVATENGSLTTDPKTQEVITA